MIIQAGPTTMQARMVAATPTEVRGGTRPAGMRQGEREREHADHAADLERRHQAQPRHEEGHDEEREREVVQEQRVPEVGAGIPALQ